jgi:hypothetical protein
MEGIVGGPRDRNSGLYWNPLPRLVSLAECGIAHEEVFRRMLSLEKKRAQRSGKIFLVALLEMESAIASDRNRDKNREKEHKAMARILSLLASTTRETDMTGWYKDHSVVGVMFREVRTDCRSLILATIAARLRKTLESHLAAQPCGPLAISLEIFPEPREERIPPHFSSPALDGEIAASEAARRIG